MPSQTFTSSGTWSCPLNYLPGSLVAQCWGEGGNGANGLTNSHSGAGGGGGEFAQDSPAVTAGNNYTVTIGTGGTGTNTTFVGDVLTVTAHFGGNGSGTGGGAAGSGSTNATVFSGGTGGNGHTSAGNNGGGGGGGSAGASGAGGTGGSGTTTTGGTGGSAGAGGGASGGNGSATTSSNAQVGNAPGAGGGGGRATSSLSSSGASGAAGQVILTWSTFVPLPPAMVPRRNVVAPQLRRNLIRSTVGFVPELPLVTTEAVRFPQHVVAQLIRHGRAAAPTGWPVPVQPPEIPSSEHARFKPPYPRKGVAVTQFPTRNVPPTESYRARFKPPWPRRGVVSPTGWPVPVQPPFSPGSGERLRIFRPLRRKPSGVLWPGTPPVLIQPPWSSWIYKRRWSRPLLPRKGVVAPQALPPPPIVSQLNPTYERRPQKFQWYRRGNVVPTGWPITVQPPTTSQSLRRWYKPPWPRHGVIAPTNLPEPVPTSWRFRARFKPPYPRKGNPQPNSGLPVPVQPKEVPHSIRRSLRPLYPVRKSQPFSAFFIPVQPPERMQSIRRWSRPLWPRRGRVNIATFPGTQPVLGYLPLTLQTFTYIPGGPGVDLTTVNLTLFPLNRIGFSFWNPYGDVIFVVYNNTSHPIPITPNVIRTVELQPIELPAYIVQPGIMQAFGPFPPNDFSNPQLNIPQFSYYMTIAVEASDSGVYAGAFRMVPAPPIGHTGQYDLLGGRLRRLIRRHATHTSSTPGEIHPGESTPGA